MRRLYWNVIGAYHTYNVPELHSSTLISLPTASALCSCSPDIYNEWCSLCGARICVVEPREHHLSDDSVCPSLSLTHAHAPMHARTLTHTNTHTHAWPAGNTGSCCIRPLWQGQLERSRRSTSSLLILSPLERERQAVRRDRKTGRGHTLTQCLSHSLLTLSLWDTHKPWPYSNLTTWLSLRWLGGSAQCTEKHSQRRVL